MQQEPVFDQVFHAKTSLVIVTNLGRPHFWMIGNDNTEFLFPPFLYVELAYLLTLIRR